MTLCAWCKANEAQEDDTLCVGCWGCKSAGLDREECLEDDADDILFMGIRHFLKEEGCTNKVSHRIALEVSQMLIAIATAITSPEE